MHEAFWRLNLANLGKTQGKRRQRDGLRVALAATHSHSSQQSAKVTCIVVARNLPHTHACNMRRIVVAVAAALVTAKTGTTPDPMYEIDAVCADWWHAEGCFNPTNPDVDRSWPSDAIEEIFTAALEGREPGACASCGFGSTAADLPRRSPPSSQYSSRSGAQK